MVDAGQGKALRECEPEDEPDVRAAAADYLRLAGGDRDAALLLAVADGMAMSSHVSRSFVRWGRPQRHRP